MPAQGDGKGMMPSRSMKHVLTNVIGAREQADVHLSEFDLSPGDTILLCSDGLHGVLDDEMLREMMASADAPEALTARMIEAALARGVKDNVTAVVARYGGE